MIKLLLLIVFTYGIAFIPALECLKLLEDEFITTYIRDIQYCIMAAYAFELMPRKRITERKVLLSWIIFSIIESQQYFILQYRPEIYIKSYIIIAGITITILIYNLLKPHNKLITYSTCIQKEL